MKTPRIPADWLHMSPGDRIATVMPFHRIKAIMDVMEPLGWGFDTEPSARGYWLVCTSSPAQTEVA